MFIIFIVSRGRLLAHSWLTCAAQIEFFNHHLVACDGPGGIFYKNYGNQKEWVKLPGGLVNCDLTSDDGTSVPGAKVWDYSVGEGWNAGDAVPAPEVTGPGISHVRLVGCNSAHQIWRINYG